MNYAGTVEAAWSILEGGVTPSLGDISIVPTDVTVLGEAVLLARDSDGRRHLFVPVGPGEQREDTASAGVHITPRTLLDGAGGRLHFCDVACRADHLEELFTEIASEMLADIRNTPAEPVLACITVLERWRELLSPERLKLLGAEALASLLGELLYLDRIIARDPQRDLSIWRGPLREPHDFRRGDVALEVKTSLARNGRPIEVHGHLQLEPPPDGILYLGWIRLARAQGQGVSVPDVIAGLRRAGVAMHRLVRLLAELGYSLADERAYRNVVFDVAEWNLYRVDESFPRIVPASFNGGSLPPGTSDLRYHIDLGGEPPFPLPGEACDTGFNQLAGVAGSS